MRQQIAADRDTVFLPVDDSGGATEFAETGTYTPIGSGSRSVVAVVEDAGSFDEGENRIEIEEVITVWCPRDKSADGGGIDKPQIGDKWLSPVSIDPQQRPYLFTGNTTDVEPDAWALEFRRTKVVQEGTNTRQP